MKSKASLKSHPIHPILVTFPIALFISTFVFDVMFQWTHGDLYRATARMLSIGGIGTALLAAIPGVIDFIYTVPPQSSAKKRGARHGLLNVTVVILFVIAFYLRDNEGSMTPVILLEGAGVILLGFSGWLGGTLVYRNQIGVDPRYANAGKWKEQHVAETDNGVIEVGSTTELRVNQMKLVHVGKRRIVLARTENGYKAFDDRCTHRGGSLAGGAMICGTAQCPWHGSQFTASDGRIVAGPATEKIAVFPVEERAGKIFLRLAAVPKA